MIPYQGRGVKVLVVDDIDSNIELVSGVMEGCGYHVLGARSGVEAIEIYQKERPDIAIVDVMMPEMDGFQLCQALKDLSGRTFLPVILLTALSDTDSKIKGLECGADDFISKPFNPRELIAKVKALLRLKFLYDELEHSENIILTLAVAMEARDPYTKGHSSRVADMAFEFGRSIGLTENECESLRKAGMLHDIGKIAISETILQKPSPLTPEEMQKVRQHPVIGEHICRPLLSLQSILPAIRHHHERWDGKGFPDALRGNKIPLFARILSIVDSFDAMLSERPYRRAMNFSTAIKKMSSEAHLNQWDPELVEIFLRLLTEKAGEIKERWYSSMF